MHEERLDPIHEMDYGSYGLYGDRISAYSLPNLYMDVQWLKLACSAYIIIDDSWLVKVDITISAMSLGN